MLGPDVLLQQALNGVGVGMIYFLIAVGLTLIFGIMDFVNFAHGAFYLVGAYALYALVDLTGSFWLGLLAGPLLVAALAWLLERALLRRLYQLDHMFHILLTFGLALVVGELAIVACGAGPRNVS